MKTEKLIGTFLIIASGFIYSFDRAAFNIQNTIFQAGKDIEFVGLGESYSLNIETFTFDNLFAWTFLIIGTLTIIGAYVTERLFNNGKARI